MKREEPSLEDYLATGALCNVPLWIYLLLLSFDVNRYTESNPMIFYTVVPIILMAGGGYLSSYLMCRRVKKHTLRIGILFGVSATIINLVFGAATSAPSAPFVAALCFVIGAAVAVIVRRKKDKELEMAA